MRHQNTLLAILTLSTVMLFGIGSASARSNEVGMAKKNMSVAKAAHTGRGEANRHENRRRDDNRNHQNDRPRRETRQPVPRANRSHNQDRRHAQPVPKSNRHADKNNHHRNYREAYRGSWRQHEPRYYRKQPGYWLDYHSGHKYYYRHRYYHGRHYYYNQIGFYFPGFGYIAHGHIHNRHCPHWHFEPFATGLILGAILSR